MHGKAVLNEDVSIDTTAQPKNITYPTDTKLAVKIIRQCRKIAEEEAVELRQSYKFVETDLLKKANSKSQKQAKVKKKARKKLKTIANRLGRELKRKLNEESLVKHQEKLEIYERVLRQKKDDKDKIYSLHELEVGCIAKGKEHKKYEFGSKVAFAVGQKSNVIKAAVSFKGNPNDNQTVEKTIEQQKKLTGEVPKKAYVDRGIKSGQIGETQVIAPSNGKGKAGAEKARLRKGFRRRAGIEPIIGHVKSDCFSGEKLLERRSWRPNERHLSGKCIQFSELDEKSIRKHNFCPQLSTNSEAILVTKAIRGNLSRDFSKATQPLLEFVKFKRCF